MIKRQRTLTKRVIKRNVIVYNNFNRLLKTIPPEFKKYLPMQYYYDTIAKETGYNERIVEETLQKRNYNKIKISLELVKYKENEG